MRRLLLGLALCGALAPGADAQETRWTSAASVVASGTCAAANVRLATVAGGALFWCEGTNLGTLVAAGGRCANGSCSVELSNAGGTVKAYTGAQGGGEALGAEQVDAWTNSPTLPFETWTPGAGNLITRAVNDGAGSDNAFKDVVPVAGTLMKCVNAITLASGQMPTLAYTSPSNTVVVLALTANDTSYKTIADATASRVRLISSAATDFAVTAFSLKQVTAPDPKGFALRTVPALGGAQSVLSNTGLTPNAALTYVIKRLGVRAWPSKPTPRKIVVD